MRVPVRVFVPFRAWSLAHLMSITRWRNLQIPSPLCLYIAVAVYSTDPRRAPLPTLISLQIPLPLTSLPHRYLRLHFNIHRLHAIAALYPSVSSASNVAPPWSCVTAEAGFPPETAELVMVPLTTIELAEEHQEGFVKFLEALEGSEDVDTVYHDA